MRDGQQPDLRRDGERSEQLRRVRQRLPGRRALRWWILRVPRHNDCDELLPTRGHGQRWGVGDLRRRVLRELLLFV